MTYDYLCTSCGHSWEAEQRISEDPLKQCPVCKEMSAKRQVSGGAGFILKGGGWYSDLYSSPKAAKSSEKPAESSSACAAGACGTSACPAASSASPASSS